jgi:hypothetical protein
VNFFTVELFVQTGFLEHCRASGTNQHLQNLPGIGRNPLGMIPGKNELGEGFRREVVVFVEGIPAHLIDCLQAGGVNEYFFYALSVFIDQLDQPVCRLSVEIADQFDMQVIGIMVHDHFEVGFHGKGAPFLILD